MRPHRILLATLVLAPFAAAASQSIQDLRAFVALRTTHIGALTPMLSPVLVGQQLQSAQLGLRYGLQREADITTHAVAGSGIFGVGTASALGVHAGVSDADCADCAPEMMLGVSGEMRVFEVGDVFGAGSVLNVGVSGDVGYAQLKPDRSALALGVGAPMALNLNAGSATGMRIVPYFTPMLGVGQINDCGSGTGSCSGTRVVLGGGVGIWNPATSISASLGINHVLLEGQDPVFGVNVVFGGR